MTTFESEAIINKPINEVYAFLADMNNHQQLMPENIRSWSSTVDEARFDIQNMASLAIKIDSRVENSQIKIIPIEKPPFDIKLNWLLSAENGFTKAKFIIAAELNLMMKMMASGPLKKLADHQTQKLAEAFA